MAFKVNGDARSASDDGMIVGKTEEKEFHVLPIRHIDTYIRTNDTTW